jgi:hypothetical protein
VGDHEVMILDGGLDLAVLRKELEPRDGFPRLSQERGRHPPRRGAVEIYPDPAAHSARRVLEIGSAEGVLACLLAQDRDFVTALEQNRGAA